MAIFVGAALVIAALYYQKARRRAKQLQVGGQAAGGAAPQRLAARRWRRACCACAPRGRKHRAPAAPVQVPLRTAFTTRSLHAVGQEQVCPPLETRETVQLTKRGFSGGSVELKDSALSSMEKGSSGAAELADAAPEAAQEARSHAHCT